MFPPPTWVYELLRFGFLTMFIAVSINSFLWSRLQIQSDVGYLIAYIELVVISDILVLQYSGFTPGYCSDVSSPSVTYTAMFSTMRASQGKERVQVNSSSVSLCPVSKVGSVSAIWSYT